MFLVICIEISLLARRKSSIIFLTVDVKNLSATRSSIVSGLEENLPILITSDIKSVRFLN